LAPHASAARQRAGCECATHLDVKDHCATHLDVKDHYATYLHVPVATGLAERRAAAVVALLGVQTKLLHQPLRGLERLGQEQQ
jgi:hypothetical protein